MAQALWQQIVPARHRAVLALWTQGRINPASQCARQAQALIKLLQNDVCSDPSARTTRVYMGHCEEEDDRALTAAPNSSSTRVRCNSSRRLPSDACLEACISLLDGENNERWLSGRRTQALARATLQEALLRAHYDASMAHERDLMLRVVGYLEAIEQYLSQRYDGFPTKDGEQEELALLRHLGRGMDLLRRVAGGPP